MEFSGDVSKYDQYIIRYLMGEKTFILGAQTIEYRYISNPDGTIRWIFPKSLSKPNFLRFYAAVSPRALLIRNIIKLAFLLRVPKVVSSGQISLQVSEESRLGRVLSKHKGSNFSIFTGTLGENRKAIIEITNDSGITTFVKVGITRSSRALVVHEVTQLSYLSKLNLEQLVVPCVIDSNPDGVVELTNVRPKKFRSVRKLTSLHIAALTEIYRSSNRSVAWQHLNLSQRCKDVADTLDNFDYLSDRLSFDRVVSLVANVQRVVVMLESNTNNVKVALSHGDFTPWNMYLKDELVYLFDWELSQFDVPIAFDLFHFVFQSKVMIDGAGYHEVKNELDRVRRIPGFQNLADHYGIDFNACYHFYLASTLAYYIPKYVVQGELHDQALLILDVLEEAMSVCLSKRGKVFD